MIPAVGAHLADTPMTHEIVRVRAAPCSPTPVARNRSSRLPTRCQRATSVATPRRPRASPCSSYVQVQQDDVDAGEAVIVANASATSPLGTFWEDVSVSAELLRAPAIAAGEKQPVASMTAVGSHWLLRPPCKFVFILCFPILPSAMVVLRVLESLGSWLVDESWPRRRASGSGRFGRRFSGAADPLVVRSPLPTGAVERATHVRDIPTWSSLLTGHAARAISKGVPNLCKRVHGHL